MKEQEFWDLINNAHAQVADIDEELSILSTKLKGLSSDEIVDFECRYCDCYERAYRWDLWGAAYLINGGCSSDGFEYFIGWLIAQGQETFEAVLKDPECLANFEIEGDAECEGMLGLASDAYKKVTGARDFYDRVEDLRRKESPQSTQDGEPLGESWEENELPLLFPELAKRYSPNLID